MGFRDDIANGAQHGVDSELTVYVPPIPGILPAGMLFTAIESDEVRRSVGTFTTKDGRAHSVGRVTQAQSMTMKVYAAEAATVSGLEAWHEAVLAGVPGHKVTPTITKQTAGGAPSSVRELEGCFPTQVADSGVGSDGAAMYTVTLSYDRALPIAI